jgi:hypothetical protein
MMNREIKHTAAELVLELAKATPEDYQKMKLMMLASVKSFRVKIFLQKVFILAEERRPLLIEMK